MILDEAVYTNRHFVEHSYKSTHNKTIPVQTIRIVSTLAKSPY
jgi:hypothetical protein